jgi:hypothetical protein
MHKIRGPYTDNYLYSDLVVHSIFLTLGNCPVLISAGTHVTLSQEFRSSSESLQENAICSLKLSHYGVRLGEVQEDYIFTNFGASVPVCSDAVRG